MKKKYISPELFMEHVELQQIVCASITKIDGDADITYGGEEENPTSGDARRKDVWDDDDENEGY